MTRRIMLTFAFIALLSLYPDDGVRRIGNCRTTPNQARCLGGLQVGDTAVSSPRFYKSGSMLLAFIGPDGVVHAQTKEDEQQLQIAVLKQQLAQAVAAQAKCEAEGSQAARLSQDASLAAQSLVSALAAKGLRVDPQTGKIVPVPKTDEKAPAPAK